jgi:hypothetical protein
MNLKRGLLQILLAASLLAAQHGALAHGLLHAQQNLSAESSKEDGGGQKSSASLCDFHMVFAEVLGAVGGHYGAVGAPFGVGGARDRATNPHYGATYAHDGACDAHDGARKAHDGTYVANDDA